MAGQSTGIKQASIYATWTPYGVTYGVTKLEHSANALNLGRFCLDCGTLYRYHTGIRHKQGANRVQPPAKWLPEWLPPARPMPASPCPARVSGRSLAEHISAEQGDASAFRIPERSGVWQSDPLSARLRRFRGLDVWKQGGRRSRRFWGILARDSGKSGSRLDCHGRNGTATPPRLPWQEPRQGKTFKAQ